MSTQLSFDETFILSIWVELILYGLYLGLFCVSICIIVQDGSYKTTPRKIMFGTMVIMFVLATIHMGINLYRLLRGYVWLRDAPGGPAAYFADLARWDHIVKDSIYVTQTLLGDTLVIYRCWIVWSNSYRVIVLPLALLISSAYCGINVCWLFTKASGVSIFASRLAHYITVYFSLCFTENILTTAAVSILKPEDNSGIMAFVRIVVESAAIYAAATFILLLLYTPNLNIQYIALETITPIVGIVFTSITVRLALHNRKTVKHQTYTTSIPMQPMTVHIMQSIETDVELRSKNEDNRLFSTN
ncbi:hypothetical protein K439DRAFT_1664515 [Ramaria rubella]|nr:hypothetical protein K439DRAFT_1664515 [Ramaria rubella]